MQGRTAASTAVVLLSGAAFGAAAVLLGGFVVRGLGGMSYECQGSWPEGAAVWWWLLAGAGLLAVGRAGHVLGRRGRKVPPEEPRDAIPRNAKAWGPTGSEARVRPAVLLGKEEREPAAPRSSRLGGAERAALAVAVCLGLLAGAWGVWPAGEDGTAAGRPESKPPARPTLAWQVPRVGDGQGPGTWGLPDGIVDGRLDGLHAYGGADGKVRWNVAVPAREAVCVMSPRVDGNIGLLAYGRHDKPCATLVAVHTGTGKVLWKQRVGGDGVPARGIAVGGTVAVAVEGGTVRGRAAESGAQRWQRALGKGCAIPSLDADATRALLVEQCGDRARLLALDPATGKELWTRALPVESTVQARVVSVAPAVVALLERDDRGTRALLGFDDTGAPTATVPLSGPDGTVVVFDDDRPLVFGDVLVARVERSSSVAEKTVGYSLKDGRKLWEHEVADSDELMVDALARQPDGTLALLVRTLKAPKVVLLDAATGRVRSQRVPEGEDGLTSIYPELFPVAGGHVVVNHLSMSGEPAVFAIR
ncbi:outer membrane protein assembly factor BamB family protein [Streptomyces sp. NPDC054835]|uniref:outer membrane protein assembly factor BamB family protein n=1 Tax=Streptomyces sp. NBC_01268 TaxID=2903806 RepID=UPI002E2F30AD|nr:PQQ-binding-like beta-propeller repeat protein [Streptomyces sp. NBC_01268]